MTSDLPVRVQRTNLVVADLERAYRVYRDILGFKLDFTLGHRPESYSFVVFQIPREATTGFAALSSKDQVRSLALTEIKGVELPEPNLPSSHALVLEVDDIDGVLEAARAEGLHSLSGRNAAHARRPRWARDRHARSRRPPDRALLHPAIVAWERGRPDLREGWTPSLPG